MNHYINFRIIKIKYFIFVTSYLLYPDMIEILIIFYIFINIYLNLLFQYLDLIIYLYYLDA